MEQFQKKRVKFCDFLRKQLDMLMLPEMHKTCPFDYQKNTTLITGMRILDTYLNLIFVTIGIPYILYRSWYFPDDV